MNARHDFEFLSNGGEMGALTRAHDWDASILGAPDTWPEALKTVVRVVLTSHHPMFIWWGPELIQFYNDAYRQTMGPERHPSALGQPGRECWGEIWPIIGPQIESVMAGGPSTWHIDQLVPVTRHGRLENVWWTYGYSPIEDSSGVRGVLVVCNDVTQEHESKAELERLNRQLVAEVGHRKEVERNLAFQLRMVDRLRGLHSGVEIAEAAFDLMSRHFQVSRINYAEIIEGTTFRIVHAWEAPSMRRIAGMSGELDTFGPDIIGPLRSGEVVISSDVRNDPRTAGYAQTYESIGARAFVAVPVIRAGQLVALLTLHQVVACQWHAEQVSLLADVADRVWIAIEHATAQSRRARAEASLLVERLAESERLCSLFQQAPGFMAILRGPDHVMEFVNAAYLRMVGEREVQGKPLREALPEVVEQGFVELLDHVYRSGEPFAANDVLVKVQRLPHAPAVSLHLDFVYQPIVGPGGTVTGIFVEGIDATERHLARAALEASEERLKEGMVAARMAIWHLDLASGEVRSENAADVFGTAVHKLDDFSRNVHPDDGRRMLQKLEEAVAARDTCETLVRFIRPDSGATVWLQSRGRVMCDANGQPCAMRGISIDVTERKRAEEALREADRRKDEFLAMLAHELRNPLAPVSAAARLLSLAPHDVDRVRLTSEVISRQVDHMTSLVNDLLDVSRVTTGLVTLECAPVDLRMVASESTEQVRPMLEAAGHRFTLNLPASPAIVDGDQKRLVQVMTNLLQNAVKYTPPCGEISLSVVHSAGEVAVTVSDNGTGIDQHLLPHVFELFTQEKRASDRSQGGLGLGLALVRSLVNLHGGHVQAASGGRGHGASFTVHLPLLPTAQAAKALDAPAPASIGKVTPMRLLLVDDNVDAARVLAMYLQAAGHEVAVEHKAEAALERIGSGTHDAYLLDIGLPGMDGNELARCVRANPQSAQARLIAISGYGQEYDRSTSLAAGFDDYLVKPADPAVLLALLARAREPAAAAQNE